MRPEFYRSRAEILPTFTLALAVSLAGANAAIRRSAASITSWDKPSLGSLFSHTYYMRAEPVMNSEQQVESLQRFAENLLKESQDNPQAIVDALNQHFWELV